MGVESIFDVNFDIQLDLSDVFWGEVFSIKVPALKVMHGTVIIMCFQHLGIN